MDLVLHKKVDQWYKGNPKSKNPKGLGCGQRERGNSAGTLLTTRQF